SYYKPPIALVSSSHGSSSVASDSLNTTPLTQKINKLEKPMLDGKLILVDDDGKPLNKADSDPVNSDSKCKVEVAYDETAQFVAIEDYDIYDTFDIGGLTKQELSFCDMMDINLRGHSRR
nr:hypothetical protein [Tanacetum cinerariifolium]